MQFLRLPLFLLVGAGLAIYGCSTPSRDVAATPVTRSDALAAFQRVYQVATSVRCVNCHSTNDRPWQGEPGARHVHTMNVQRGIANVGGSCMTCHGLSNWDVPHLPPGTQAGWTMPTAAKGYTATITPHALCEMYRDGNHNFFEDDEFFQTGKKRPRTGQDLIEHVRDTEGGLVAWSFAPGPGRSTPPESHDEFVAHVTTWVRGNMPCPN